MLNRIWLQDVTYISYRILIRSFYNSVHLYIYSVWTMCSQNQNFYKFISVFHKKHILPQNGISLYELILYSLVHHYQQFRTIPHQNIKEQDILVICKCTRFVFFFYFWPAFTTFLFSIQAFLWRVLLATCMFSFAVYLLMPLLTNMWDPPLPFTPLLSTGQVDRPGLFVWIHHAGEVL